MEPTLTLDPIVRVERLIVGGQFVGVITLSFPNKEDCHISGFNCDVVSLIRYRKVLFDLIKSTGRRNVHYTRYIRGREFKRVVKL